MIDKNLTIPNRETLSEKELEMMLDPLGFDALKDIDEIYCRNRRKSDDPYIKATQEKLDYRFPKIENAERR